MLSTHARTVTRYAAFAIAMWFLVSGAQRVRHAEEMVRALEACIEVPEVACSYEARKTARSYFALWDGGVGHRFYIALGFFALSALLIERSKPEAGENRND